MHKIPEMDFNLKKQITEYGLHTAMICNLFETITVLEESAHLPETEGKNN